MNSMNSVLLKARLNSTTKCGQDQINFHFHPTNMPVTLPEFVSNDCARWSLYDWNSLVPEGNVTV